MFFIEGNNNARYVVRYDFEDDKYRITATDLVRVWTETMSPEEIIERCKELNPNVEAPPKSLLTRVLNFLETSDATTRANIAMSQGNMHIHVQNRTSGFLFRFKFVLAPSDPVEV